MNQETLIRPPLAELRGVTHEFRLPGGQTLRVVEDIDLVIRPDEVVALLGPSGCGKSTLLRILAGLVKPTRGEVLMHGRPLAGLNTGVAIVFQTFALYPWMTVRQNVTTALEARGVPRSEVDARALDAVRKVGLAGFEQAYPRELSGGMKQRAGMARALSVDPELLFMDEPFSHVDALTAESLRAEVIDIWAAADRNPSAIVLVSHDIQEVAWMADRIVVLAARPGRVRRILENPLPRPRDYRSRDLQRLVESLHEIITGVEMPDEPEAAAGAPVVPEVGVVEPLPSVTPVEISGLLEYLDSRNDREDVFRIAADTLTEFGHVIAVVKAAELLDFVDTPKRNVELTANGRRYLNGNAEQRRAVWREQLLTLRLFRDIERAIAAEEDGRLERDVLAETVALHLPQEDSERTADTVIQWAQAGDLFTLDETDEWLVRPAHAAP